MCRATRSAFPSFSTASGMADQSWPITKPKVERPRRFNTYVYSLSRRLRLVINFQIDRIRFSLFFPIHPFALCPFPILVPDVTGKKERQTKNERANALGEGVGGKCIDRHEHHDSTFAKIAGCVCSLLLTLDIRVKRVRTSKGERGRKKEKGRSNHSERWISSFASARRHRRL